MNHSRWDAENYSASQEIRLFLRISGLLLFCPTFEFVPKLGKDRVWPSSNLQAVNCSVTAVCPSLSGSEYFTFIVGQNLTF